MSAPYAELATSTCFSFLRGASTPEEMVETALALGHAGLAVTDRNTLAGVVRPWTLLGKLKTRAQADGQEEAVRTLEAFRYVVGTRLAFCDGTPDVLAYPLHRAGYGRLCRLLTQGNLRARKGECELRLPDLLKVGEGLALALVPPARPDAPSLAAVLDALAAAHPGFVWLAAAMSYGPADARRLDALAALAQAAGTPLLAVNDVLHHAPHRRRLQDVMTAIREHTTVREAGRRLQPNAERRPKPPDEMARLFRDHPGALEQVGLILGLCAFDLGELRYEYPQEPVPPGLTPQAHLEDLSWKGLRWRYGEHPPARVVTQMQEEFAFIDKRQYAHYFLTVHSIVSFARSRGILCQGRGSAANSVVCFCLGVTAVDPAHHKLLFARFISEERLEPPDIDVDFEHERREEVIQHLYETYGRERAAICATVIHYRPRSAIREVGKTLGLSEDVTAALAGMVWGSWGGEPDPEHVRQTGLDPDNPQIKQALELAGELLEFPRHLSQHVGGFVLTQERLDETVPILNGAMPDRTFIEWDKDDIDALGLMKVDVLALGMLSCIRRAFELLNQHRIHAIADMAELEDNRDTDQSVYEMLGRGDTVGVFQIESRAQMNMLPRLKPRCFYDLAIEVAIVRPGPIQGDMVHPYLRRKQGLEAVVLEGPTEPGSDPHELEHVLGRTMGVPLFQEQAMQVAITAARFTGAEADGLRRAMATFRRTGGVTPYKAKMVGGMVARGYPQDFAERCFKQIEGFGSYGFPESHAISFAKLVYVSAWLKRHHPRGVRRRPSERPADGLLRPRPDRARRARARRGGARRRRGLQRLGLHARAGGGRGRGRRGLGAAAGPARDRGLCGSRGAHADGGRPAAGAGGGGRFRRLRRPRAPLRPDAVPAPDPGPGRRPALAGAGPPGGPVAGAGAVGGAARAAAEGCARLRGARRPTPHGAQRARGGRLSDHSPVAEGPSDELPAAGVPRATGGELRGAGGACGPRAGRRGRRGAGAPAAGHGRGVFHHRGGRDGGGQPGGAARALRGLPQADHVRAPAGGARPHPAGRPGA